jgi:hypothetical protein
MSKAPFREIENGYLKTADSNVSLTRKKLRLVYFSFNTNQTLRNLYLKMCRRFSKIFQ